MTCNTDQEEINLYTFIDDLHLFLLLHLFLKLYPLTIKFILKTLQMLVSFIN